MKTVLVTVLVVVLSIIGFCAAVLASPFGDYIYYPLIENKVEKKAIAYLKSSSQEDFVIDDVTYSKPFGEDKGKFFITAHTTAKPEIELFMNVNQDLSMDQESFKESKWRYDTILEYVPLIDEISPGFSSYAVNMYIPEELFENYPIETKYGEIRKLHEKVTEEYLFMGTLVDSDFTEQRALEYGYHVVEFMKRRDLKDAAIEINFYQQGLKERLGENERKISIFKLQHQFINDALPYRIEFDTRFGKTKTALDEIKSPDDLKPFLNYGRQ